MYPFILLVAYRISEQVIGTWLIIFMAALIGGVSINMLSKISKKRVLSVFLILIALAFFVFILNTDDNPYFDKYSNPFTRAMFGIDSIHKARVFIEVLPKNKNFTGEHWILEHVVVEYDFLKSGHSPEEILGGENLQNFKPLLMVELDKAHEIIFIFSKYGIERNGAYHYKPLFINNFINKIKEKEANILLNSDNVIILQK
jgi:hypothetical protein